MAGAAAGLAASHLIVCPAGKGIDMGGKDQTIFLPIADRSYHPVVNKRSKRDANKTAPQGPHSGFMI